MGSIESIIILSLATYGVATLLTDYDGPFKLFKEMRQQLGVFKCSVCLSFWIAIALSLIFSFGLGVYMASLGVTIFILRNEQW